MEAHSIKGEKPSEKEILSNIILMAKKAGFRFRNLIDDYDYFSISSFNPETGRLVIVLRNDDRHQIIYDSIYLLFFDLTFAKALFGQDWEKHLIELARSANKLEYINAQLLNN